MTNSMKNRLSTSLNSANKDTMLNQIRKEFMMQIHEQTFRRNLLIGEEQGGEKNLRDELKHEKEMQDSPRSIVQAKGDLNNDSSQRLHDARDERSLKLPSLLERKSQDLSQSLEDEQTAGEPTSE